jgi:hypothetical protein
VSPSSAGRPDLVAALEADLVALSAAEADLERDAEVADRIRIERTGVSLADRLRATRAPVEVTCRGGVMHAGRVVEIGADWVLVDARTSEHVVRIAAISQVRGLGRAVERGRSRLPARSWGSVLRAWCRDRSDVSVSLVDGELVTGVASAVYADHLELSTGGGATVVVPWEAMAVVSR